MVKIFISYSHHDAEYEASLRGLLSSTQKLEIRPISDTQLKPGDRWQEELTEYMEQSDAGVLLLSRAFFESKYCKDELERLIHREPPFRLLPVLLEPCFWDDDKRLEGLHLVNPGGRSVIESEKPERALFDIAARIRQVLLEGRTRHSRRTVRRTEDTKDPWKKIGTAIEQGLFTPVLGPNCYELTENTQEARDHLRRRLDRLFAELKGDEASKTFAEGVVGSGMKEALSHRVGKEGPTPADWDEALVAFQASVAQLGAHCCRLLGNAMQESPRGFIDSRSLFAHAVDDSFLPVGSRLRARFFEATYLAVQLKKALEASSRPGRGLGIRGILAQLVMLTYSVFYREIAPDDCDEDAREWRRKHRELVSAAGRLLAPIDPMKMPRISLSDLEWIGDLLWHTIRFDAPMYPSPDEFAFQLSVCLGTQIPPRKERVGTIMEIADWQARPDLIRNFFKVYEDGASTRSEDETRFYDILARALLYVPQAVGRSIGGIRLGSAFAAARRENVRVVISTNFDRELERSFNKNKQQCHLVLPVYVRDNDHSDAESGEWAEGWLFRTVTWDIDSERDDDDQLLERSTAELDRIRIQGPVIVKLHGSPLERLKPRYMHRLSISDCDFIEAMISRDRFWPPGLRELLEAKGRVLCFVGYPLTDTRSRLRLSDHLEGEQINRTLYLVDYPEDPLRHTLLDYFDVRLVLNKLEEFPGFLEACFQGAGRYF